MTCWRRRGGNTQATKAAWWVRRDTGVSQRNSKAYPIQSRFESGPPATERPGSARMNCGFLGFFAERLPNKPEHNLLAAAWREPR